MDFLSIFLDYTFFYSFDEWYCFTYKEMEAVAYWIHEWIDFTYDIRCNLNSVHYG